MVEIPFSPTRLCVGDYDAACCDLLCWSLVGNENDDEPNREGMRERDE